MAQRRAALPENLVTARTEAKLTQKAVAKALGITDVTVSNHERGITSPDDGTLDAYSRLYGWTPAELRYGRTQKIPSAQAAGDALLPRQLRIMALDFEREALEKGADEPFMRYARNSLRDPDFVALFAGGPDESPMTAEEALGEMEAHLEELRAILTRRLERAEERIAQNSGRLAPGFDTE